MTAVLVLSFLTTLLCSGLLLRAFIRVRRGLLLWSGLCFAALTVSNLFVIADLLMFPAIDFYTWRIGWSAAGMALLLYGLIWESQ